MSDLKRAQGTLTDEEFDRALLMFKRIEPQNIAVARAFLVKPGKLQVVIAEETGMSRQLVNKHCRKLYDAHSRLVLMRKENQ